MLKLLLGRTCADRGTKITAVRDGRRNRKQACASFVSKSIDVILLKYYFTEISIFHWKYIYFESDQDGDTMGKRKGEIKIR